MKILILTAATGGGHLRAAHAIAESVRLHTVHETATVDALKAVGPGFDKLICGSYLFMARKAPALFGRMYRRSNKRNAFSELVPLVTGMVARRLLDVFLAEEPDVIVTTHPFAASMVGALKEQGEAVPPLVSLITDYGAHRAYLADNRAEAYVVACEDMIGELAGWGIPEEKVHPFGIPVHEVFFERPGREEARQALGLDPALPTVLMMAGSFGVSNIMGIYRDLAARMSAGAPRAQMVVITGRNPKLYQAFQRELEAGEKIPTTLVEFTTEVEKYMHAADLLVTKPGGLTVSEALASGLPLAAFDAIPGQEEDNAAFLERHGMAIRLKKETDAAQAISALMENPTELEKMRRACRSFDKSDCVRNMVEMMEKLE